MREATRIQEQKEREATRIQQQKEAKAIQEKKDIEAQIKKKERQNGKRNIPLSGHFTSYTFVTRIQIKF